LGPSPPFPVGARSANGGDFPNAGPKLIFIRPRRFGKSLLLSMLEHFAPLARVARGSGAETQPAAVVTITKRIGGRCGNMLFIMP
jgi:hypothetical protein